MSEEERSDERTVAAEEDQEAKRADFAITAAEDEVATAVAQAISSADTTEAKKATVAQIVSTALDEAKADVAAEAVKQLSLEDQAELMNRLEALQPEQRKAVTEAAARSLPAEYQQELSFGLAPTQPVTDWIWRVIIGAFASVFVLSVLTLCVAAVWRPNSDVQTLLTVVTTVAGILAGFISGRASAGGTPS
jgi:hypothetical protein